MPLEENDKRQGFASRINVAETEGWELKNTGYDYSSNLLNRTMSRYMFNNPNLKVFLENYLSPIMVKYINAVKYIRIFYNYAVPKDYDKIN